jgi:RimJ/RimL family protein N-acetyltransferase
MRLTLRYVLRSLLDDPGFRIDWTTDVGTLAALEPTRAELRAHATALALGYNEPDNARLMGHTAEMSPGEVIEHYEDMDADGARQFLLFVDDQLVGDADLRGVRDGCAEFAFMIAARDRQGQGLGTKFALMITAFAFETVSLRRMYASVAPENRASRRVFDKLGYTVDDSPEARGFADEPTDVTLGIDRDVFAKANAAALAQLQIAHR